MRGKKALCPACGESMTVPGDTSAVRVTCPHCRAMVSLPGTPARSLEVEHFLTLSNAPNAREAGDLLTGILEQSCARQADLEKVGNDLRALQERARMVGQWLENSPSSNEEKSAELIFQCRLFSRLVALPKGRMEIRAGASSEALALAEIISRAFVAAGWQVQATHDEKAQTHVGPALFSVGAGPMNDQIAVAHLALTLCGLHLQSVVDHEQSDHAILIMHSSLPLIILPTAQEQAPRLG